MRVARFVFILLLVSCGPTTIYIVTDGSHTQLPGPNTHAAVWGLRPPVTNTVVAWLQANGHTVVPPATLQQHFDEEKIRVTKTFEDEANVLRIAKSLDVELVVMTQSALEQTAASHVSVDQTPYPTSTNMPSTFSGASVTLRGIDVRSGTLLWTGKAEHPYQLTQTGSEVLSMLTCQALATAWGIRPAGEFAVSPEDRCMMRQHPPVPKQP